MHILARDVLIETDFVGSFAVSMMQRIGSVFLISCA